MLNIYNILGIILLITVCEAIAQSCLKQYNLIKNINYFIIGCLFYFFVILLLCKSYNYESMGKVNLCWSVFSIIFVIMMGVIFFHEKLLLIDILGIFITIVGLYLIFIYGHNKE
jgi:multidrug transporter EmrE-like cation transporter